MVVTLLDWTQARFILYAGIPGSKKSSHIIRRVSALRNSGAADNGNKYIVFKHKKDDVSVEDRVTSPTRRDEVPAICVSSVDQVAEAIIKNPDARHIFLSGIHNFEDPRIVDLVREIPDSGRNLIGTLIPLTYENQPFNHSGQVMCLADHIMMLHALCADCNAPAFRSMYGGRNPKDEMLSVPKCLRHYQIPSQERMHVSYLHEQEGSLHVIWGTMANDKSGTLTDKLYDLESTGKRTVLFHAKDRVLGITLTRDNRAMDAYVFESVVQARKLIRERKAEYIAFEEFQLSEIPGQIELIKELIDEGRNVIITLTNRDIGDRPFLDAPLVMPYATSLENNHSSICAICSKHPAVKNRRDVKRQDSGKDIWVPDSYKAGIIALDNDPAERRYQPACRDCYKVSDAPETAFKLPDYKKPA